MLIKKMKLYSCLGTTLGGLTFVFCSLYKYGEISRFIDAKLMVGILALIAVIQAIFSSLIYKNIKKYCPEDQTNDKNLPNN